MSAKRPTAVATKNTILDKVFGRDRKAKRKQAAKRGRSNLQFEGLEKRELFAVSSIFATNPAGDLAALNPGLQGKTLVVATDNASTSVTVSKVGSNIRISEVGTSRMWDYAASSIGSVQFQGGDGHDRFVNNISNLPVRAFGGGGDDYLMGFHAGDILSGGAGNDYLDGRGANDNIWGNNGNDILLGDVGNDNLMGGAGDDRLNGHAGTDNLWGEGGNDTLISIDAAYSDYLDGGANADTMWIDQGSSRDRVVGVTQSDLVQNVVSFANGADKSLNGDRITDPTAARYARFRNEVSAGNTLGTRPLFSSSGPKSEDIGQGNLPDCWLMGGLSAVAMNDPQAIRQNVVDFDDGTYGVRLGNSFYRVDNDLPVGANANQQSPQASDVRFAGLGREKYMWAAVIEKAFAHYRGANTYERLGWGNATEVFVALRGQDVGSRSIGSFGSAIALGEALYAKLKQGYSVTISATSTSKQGHVFSVSSVARDAAGRLTHVVLRNPWGSDGIATFPGLRTASGGADQNDGKISISLSDLFRFNRSESVEYGYV